LTYQEDISPDQFRLMLDRLPATVRTLDIIGGEPTVHTGIVSMIGEARERGFQVNISSNGTNTLVLEEIVQANSAVIVGVSINDRTTLEEAKAFIKTYRPVVKSVYSRGFDPSLPAAILSLAPSRYYLIYRDAIEPGDLKDALSFAEFMTAADRFRAEMVGSVYCSGFLPDIRNYPDLVSARCPAGTSKLGIMPDGSVYPCNLLFGKSDYLLGNILTDDFKKIWSHPVLDFFRKFSGNQCEVTVCRHHSLCHGGCPAHAVSHSGNPAGPDPRCLQTRHPNITLPR
jgi:radical SAM protein with 4Fe4S-binding SPASM domain